MLLTINSTAVELHHLKTEYRSLVAHHFNLLNSSLIDPILIYKSSKSPYKPYVPRSNPLPARGISKFLSKFKSINSNSNSHNNANLPGCPNTYLHQTASPQELSSVFNSVVHSLLYHKHDLNEITQIDDRLLVDSVKDKLYMSFSLQELVFFGNAIDCDAFPYTMRLFLPDETILFSCFNAYDFATIFYKLNMGRELSLDIDDRMTEPLDFCLPRRQIRGSNRRSRRRSRRDRTDTVNSLTSSTTLASIGNDSDNEAENLLSPPPYNQLPELEQLVSEIDISMDIEDDVNENDELCCQGLYTQDQELVDETLSDTPEATAYRTNSSSNSRSRSASLFSMPVVRMGTLDTVYNESNEVEDDCWKSAGRFESKYDNLVFALRCMKGCRKRENWKA